MSNCKADNHTMLLALLVDIANEGCSVIRKVNEFYCIAPPNLDSLFSLQI